MRAVLDQHILADGLPVVVDLDRSHGPWLVDAVSGEEYLDFFCSFATSALGFNHPALRNEAFAAELLPAAINKISNSDLYTREMATFVETFADVLPESLRHHLFFIEGGAPAVENALKTAFDWKTRLNRQRESDAVGNRILHFREGFHGRTGYALSITSSDPNKTRYFPTFDWPRITNPKLSFPLTDESLAVTAAAEEQAYSEINDVLALGSEEIAAIIIEPIQGEGGDNHFRPDFFHALRAIADAHDLLLIFDEVQTGFATTGRWWCFEHLGVEPDILVFGKKSQVCGIAASRRIDNVDSVFEVSSRINSTWGGSLVDMVRCRRIIEVIRENDLLGNASRVGALLLSGLEELAAEHRGFVSNTRGCGMFLAFDLPDRETRDRLLSELVTERVLALPSGSSSVRFRPPVSLSEDEAREGLRRCRSALDRVLTGAGAPR